MALGCDEAVMMLGMVMMTVMMVVMMVAMVMMAVIIVVMMAMVTITVTAAVMMAAMAIRRLSAATSLPTQNGSISTSSSSNCYLSPKCRSNLNPR